MSGKENPVPCGYTFQMLLTEKVQEDGKDNKEKEEDMNKHETYYVWELWQELNGRENPKGNK